VLRLVPDRECVDDRERALVDHRDGVVLAVGHVHQVAVPAHGGLSSQLEAAKAQDIAAARPAARARWRTVAMRI
jgi:hypothetical protein